MEAEELNDPMAVGLLSRQGVVQRTQLVAKLVEVLPPAGGANWLYIARSQRVLRRSAAFPDACDGGWPAIRCCHDRSSVVQRSGGGQVIYSRTQFNYFLSSTMRRRAVELLFGQTNIIRESAS